MSNFDELRQEFVKPSFRTKMKEELGGICVNCGSSEHIEYHHIVPLVHGGTNNMTNIVPLCWNCHQKAHNKHIHGEAYKKAKEEGKVGRKHKKTYEECLPWITAYFECRIGTKELKEKCGYSEKVKLSQAAYIKRYKKEHNVPKDFYNNIDLLEAQGRIGRNKKTTYEDALPVLEKYFGNEIGLAEAKKMLGLSPKNKSSWYEVANRYKKEHNIPKDFHNNIDLLEAQGKRCSSRAKKSS